MEGSRRPLGGAATLVGEALGDQGMNNLSVPKTRFGL